MEYAGAQIARRLVGLYIVGDHDRCAARSVCGEDPVGTVLEHEAFFRLFADHFRDPQIALRIGLTVDDLVSAQGGGKIVPQSGALQVVVDDSAL